MEAVPFFRSSTYGGTKLEVKCWVSFTYLPWVKRYQVETDLSGHTQGDYGTRFPPKSILIGPCSRQWVEGARPMHAQQEEIDYY